MLVQIQVNAFEEEFRDKKEEKILFSENSVRIFTWQKE